MLAQVSNNRNILNRVTNDPTSLSLFLIHSSSLLYRILLKYLAIFFTAYSARLEQKENSQHILQPHSPDLPAFIHNHLFCMKSCIQMFSCEELASPFPLLLLIITPSLFLSSDLIGFSVLCFLEV